MVTRQAIMPARRCGLMTVGMMADRSSVIGDRREYLPYWSFSTILCIDFDGPQWVRIAKVALRYRIVRVSDQTAALATGGSGCRHDPLIVSIAIHRVY